MKKFVLDTNALISFVTDRNPAQQQRIAEIFERASGLQARILCPQQVFSEFVFVMDAVYKVPREKIHVMLGDFLNTPGIEVVNEVNYETLLRLWPKKVPDYGDAIVASVCWNTKGSTVVTFDNVFTSILKKIHIPVWE